MVKCVSTSYYRIKVNRVLSESFHEDRGLRQGDLLCVEGFSALLKQSEENKAHWLRWELLMQPKWQGRLGFRDIHVFNLAMLAKQV
jgi:hypothetical protein